MVKEQDRDSYLIHNLEADDDMDLYMSNLQNNQKFLDLCSDINTQVNAAFENDEDLKKIYNSLNGMED